MREIRFAGWMFLVLAAGCGGSDASQPAPATPAAAPDTTAAPPPAPPAPPPPPSANPDTAAVEAARPAVRACYEKARTANPALGRTTVTVSVRVDEKGTVTTVDLEYKHKLDDTAKGCMRDAAFTIKLPAGEPRRVTVPLTFETK